jgi:drug/metabolite transporter (DMT)-like permease
VPTSLGTLSRLLPDAVRPWLGALMISFSAVWIRLADVEPARSALLRGAYAVPVLAVLVAVRRRSDRAGTPWLVPGGIAAGLLLGLDFVAFHASIGIIGAGLGTVLPSMQVVFVGIVGVWLFHERPGRTFWFSLPLVLGGMWVLSVVGEPISTAGSFPLGVLLGVVVAVFYTGVLVLLRVLRGGIKGSSTVSLLLSLTLGSTLATGPVAAFEGVFGPAGWPADGWLILLAVGSQVIGWLLVTSSIHRLPAAATSVALLLQPVLALVWGSILLAEPLGIPQFVGAGIVLLGVALANHGVRQARTQPVPKEVVA